MFCPSRGTVLQQQTRYCRQCGARLLSDKEADELKVVDKRLDEYLEGIFWIFIFGLGSILGGMILLKKILHFSDLLIIAWMLLSSVIFLIVFGLNLWQTFHLLRMRAAAKAVTSLPATAPAESLDTNELEPASAPLSLQAGQSVVEEVTRTFEPSIREKIRQ